MLLTESPRNAFCCSDKNPVWCIYKIQEEARGDGRLTRPLPMSSLPAMPRMKKQQVCKIPQCKAERELKEVDKGKTERWMSSRAAGYNTRSDSRVAVDWTNHQGDPGSGRGAVNRRELPRNPVTHQTSSLCRRDLTDWE